MNKAEITQEYEVISKAGTPRFVGGYTPPAVTR